MFCLNIFGRGHHEEHFRETILNLDQWSRRRCHLKNSLSVALEPFLCSVVEPFVPFRWNISGEIILN